MRAEAELELRASECLEAQRREQEGGTAAARQRAASEALLQEADRRLHLLSSERDAAMRFQTAAEAERLRWRQQSAALSQRVREAEAAAAEWRAMAEDAVREREELKARQRRDSLHVEHWQRKAREQRERRHFLERVIALRSVPHVLPSAETASERRRRKQTQAQEQLQQQAGQEAKESVLSSKSGLVSLSDEQLLYS